MSQVVITDRSSHSLPYKRHRPDQTLLYQIIGRPYPKFRDVMAAQDKPRAPARTTGFAGYHNCGRLEHGFLRVQ
jgi:hypothetical protein